jgi:alpha-mannosidase
MPTASFVDVSNGEHGLAVLHYGLSEYEVSDNSSRAINLTLLRCFGTAGNATEPFAPQELAQCQGTHTFRYAVAPHVGDWCVGQVMIESMKLTTPLRSMVSFGHAKGELPTRYSFLSVDSCNFVMTALKQAEYEDAIVLRGFNPTDKPFDIDITLPSSILYAKKVTLEEKSEEALAVKDGHIRLQVGRGKIISIMMSSSPLKNGKDA